MIGAWPFLWAVLLFRLARSVKPREKVAIERELSRTRTVLTQLGVVAIKTDRAFPFSEKTVFNEETQTGKLLVLFC